MDKHKIEKTLQQTLLSNLLDTFQVNFFAIDKDGFYICKNSSLTQVVGVTQKADLVNEAAWLSCKKVMRTRTKETIEELGHNGRWYFSIKAPIITANDEVAGVMGISFDITDRKKAEEELKIAKANAEAANEYKRQFMQNMEHDLRTPTLGIAGYTKVLEDRTDDPEMKKGLQMLSEAGEKLLKMLNDIIHASHASAGKFPVCSKKIDLLKVVNDVIDLERPTIIVKKLKLDFDCQPDVPQTILSDEHRVTRILLNLLSNAVKFTKQGSIKVGLGVAKKIDDSHVVLKLTVEDTGMGIPEKLQATMYDRFVRGTPSNRGIYPGSGLGLSIVKQFLDELGGKISVESKVDKGTTFTCLIPVKLPSTTKQSSPPILLIEKGELATTVESRLLSYYLPQAQLEIVKNELEAMALIRQKDYALIFVGMDWYRPESCQISRAISEITSQPIVTLTAFPLKEVEDIFRASGATEVIDISARDDIEKRFALLASLLNKS